MSSASGAQTTDCGIEIIRIIDGRRDIDLLFKT